MAFPININQLLLWFNHNSQKYFTVEGNIEVKKVSWGVSESEE
jgi:hypothetical protein